MHDIRIPKLGMDTTECDIRTWLVKVGDRVARGQEILEVETEKATAVIESEAAGVLKEILATTGQTVPVGSVVGVIDESGA